ncbi:unnamed protein product [Lactuca virosa]|uniref:NB-ARC domain-containing protein n=1 Tax=Lactuca virosa TaxID=75947 RepID=A0AAU9N6L1_9ASTR|nr:unnamed protein product [Lactuca virosa]
MQHKIRQSVNNNNIRHLVEPQIANPQVAAARVNPSGAEHEQIIVGFDEVSLSIMDRLTGEYRKQLDIISIVGMGGVAYTTRDLLIGILASMGISVHEAITEQKLCEMVYKSLKGRKYLMVIDDIWSTKAWDNLRQCFPDDNKGSRIILTTRLTEVALHAKPGGFTHNLQCLTEEKSWELLCRKSFRGYESPQTLIETGKHIAQKCQGLPLALVVIAGILEKGEKSKDLWEKVAESVSSYIADDPKGCLDTLALSYEHLPHHLKNCFLYVAGFPEDYEIQARRLIRLWMAEGFVKEEKETAQRGFRGTS